MCIFNDVGCDPFSDIAGLSDFYSMDAHRDLPGLGVLKMNPINLSVLTEAVEASWDERTSYQGAVRPGNPAYGQCYPTSRVVQWFYPQCEVAVGEVWTGAGTERHFWNVCGTSNDARWIDLSWKQFSSGAVVEWFKILDRNDFGDSLATQKRCELLLQRVLDHLAIRRVDGS